MTVVEIPDDLQCLELVLGGKTVAALCLDRSSSEYEHMHKSILCLYVELVFGRSPRGFDGGMDTAAGIEYVEVSYAMKLLRKLVLAPSSKYEMRV